MRFEVVLCLWSVTSCSCIDKSRKVAKAKLCKNRRVSERQGREE